MGGGSKSGGSSTTVQKADPWSGVQPYLSTGYKQLRDLYMPGGQLGEGPQYFPTSTVADPNALEGTGQDMQIDATSQQQQAANQALQAMYGMGIGSNFANIGAGQALGASQGLMGAGQYGLGAGLPGATQGMNQLLAAGDVENNPYFQQAMQSAIRPVTEQFTEQVMPGIRQGAIGAGQMGGSRQGIAEGIAARGYLDTVGDITANMGSQAYGQGLQAVQAGGALGGQLAGLGLSGLGTAGGLGQGLFGEGMTAAGRLAALAPTVQQSLLMPGQTLEQIGQQRTADEQAQIDANLQRWNYEQQLPYSMMSDYLAMLNASQGGTTASTMSGQQGGGNRMMSALGGAATGSMFGPWGALAGGALGLFM